jgi:hypothetical protein
MRPRRRFLAEQPAQAVPAPLASSRHPAVVRDVSANGADEFCERGARGTAGRLGQLRQREVVP